MITGQMTGTAIRRIILDKIRASYVPLTDLAEQNQISNQIERHLSVADRTKKTVKQNLVLATRFRQSILQKAFEGNLVQQNPSDEPAATFLERVRALKATKRSKFNDSQQKQTTQTELSHYAQ